MRVDAALVAQGHAASRDRARAMIAAGSVFLNGQKLSKPAKTVPTDSIFDIQLADIPWVSRGALKLLGGLASFPAVDPTGLHCADIGASTGGFTEVLLAEGAASVAAIDVGTAQLHPTLVANPKVQVLDGVNARALNADHLLAEPQLIVCDASFISLVKILPAVMGLAAPGCQMLALIKPQFEVGKGRVGKGGIVRDSALHQEVTDTIRQWLIADMKWTHLGTVPSPIDGPDGNKEFLIAATKP